MERARITTLVKNRYYILWSYHCRITMAIQRWRIVWFALILYIKHALCHDYPSNPPCSCMTTFQLVTFKMSRPTEDNPQSSNSVQALCPLNFCYTLLTFISGYLPHPTLYYSYVCTCLVSPLLTRPFVLLIFVPSLVHGILTMNQ